MASAGLALVGGTLRASYGVERNYDQRFYGLGYARQIGEKSLGLFGTFGTGVDFSGSYAEGGKLSPYAPRAVRLAIPLSLRWGSPSRLSLTPYVAPYAELGRADLVRGNCDSSTNTCTGVTGISPGRTYSAGLGAGALLTAWKVSLEAGVIGVPTRANLYSNGGWKASAGLRFHF
jgi:hypothetical protein